MRTREKKAAARQIIRRVQEIAHNDMLMRLTYITIDVERPDLLEAGAVCGGRRACMVGSFMLAAGEEPDNVRDWLGQRDKFAASIPGAAEARAALNEAALKIRFKGMGFYGLTGESARDERKIYARDPAGHDPMETLFESSSGIVYRSDLPKLVLKVTDGALELLK